MEQFRNLTKDEHHMFTSEDDKVMMKLINTTHAHDCHVVNVEPLLQLIKDILKLSTTTAAKCDVPNDPVGHAMESLKENTPVASFKALTYTIHKISCEISCKCTRGGEGDNTMLALIKTLSNYSWDAKVVLVMAAFAVTYGEFFLLLEAVGADKSKPLETLRKLIEAMVNPIDCIVNFSKLPNQESLDQSVVQTVVYWIIRSAVACVPQFFGFLGLGYEYTLSRVENEELSKLLKNLNVSHRHLKEELKRYQQSIDEGILSAEYEEVVQLFATTHIDNIKILNALIKAKDGLPPLFQMSTQQRVGVEVLKKKNVLLFISELDVFQKDIGILVEMHRKSMEQPTRQESQFEVVCLTVGEWTEAKEGDFKLLLSEMPWKWMHHDRKDAVIKYIKEVWHFNKKPILVALDSKGKVISPNAFPMIKINRSINFPIPIEEDNLLNQAKRRLQLLRQTIHKHKRMLKWVNILLFFLLLLLLHKGYNYNPCSIAVVEE